jgi:Holliday junction resolvasome RuvABC endonuclease subunit
MIEIMGVDPSLTHTGICLPNGSTGSIVTGDAKRGDRRLYDLERAFRHYVRSWPCALAVVEDIPFSSKGNTAGAAFGHAIVRLILAEFGIPVALIVPATLKMFATGRGNADKPEMVAAMNRHDPLKVPPTKDHNQADAWWLRQMGLWWQGDRRLDPMMDEIIGSDAVRQKCVFGPWRKSPGAKWPAQVRAAAAR